MIIFCYFVDIFSWIFHTILWKNQWCKSFSDKLPKIISSSEKSYIINNTFNSYKLWNKLSTTLSIFLTYKFVKNINVTLNNDIFACNYLMRIEWRRLNVWLLLWVSSFARMCTYAVSSRIFRIKSIDRLSSIEMDRNG